MSSDLTGKASKRRWALAFLVGLALAAVAIILTGLGASLVQSVPVEGLALAVRGVLIIPLMTIAVWLALRVVGVSLPEIGLVTTHWRPDLLIGIAAGVGWALLQFLVIIPVTGGAERSDVIASRALIGESWMGVAGALVVGLAAGYNEELFFRGHIITTLRHALGNSKWAVGIAVFVSAFLFGITHTYQGWVGVLDTGTLALIMAALYLWRGRLIAPMVAHAVFDVLAITILFIFF